MNYSEMKQILQGMMTIAKKLQQEPARKRRELGYETQEKAQGLVNTFVHIAASEGCKYDAVRSAFDKIVGKA